MTRTRTSWLGLVVALAACGADDTPAQDQPSTIGAPTRTGTGTTGEAGAPGAIGPKGDKGEPGIMAATEIFGNKPGALPMSGDLTTSGGRLLITVSGSAYRAATAGTLGVDVSIDGIGVGAINGFTNEAASHKTLPSRSFIVQQGVGIGVGGGVHTLTLSAQPDTVTDANDYFNVTVLELR